MHLQMPRPKIATCLSDSHCCWKSRPNAEKIWLISPISGFNMEDHSWHTTVTDKTTGMNKLLRINFLHWILLSISTSVRNVPRITSKTIRTPDNKKNCCGKMSRIFCPEKSFYVVCKSGKMFLVVNPSQSKKTHDYSLKDRIKRLSAQRRSDKAA